MSDCLAYAYTRGDSFCGVMYFFADIGNGEREIRG